MVTGAATANRTTIVASFSHMELPAGVNPVDVTDENRRRYVLKLNKSLYGLKQAGYNWFEKL